MLLNGDNLTFVLAEWTASAAAVWAAGGVTLAFTLLARVIRGVGRWGAVVGAIICFTLYVCAGPGAFVALASVFVLAWLTTRLGYRRKQHLGTAEKRDGRTASQVLANLGIAGVCALAVKVTRNDVFLLALVAALSEAAADTVSSEVGQAVSSKARLITTWREVPAGTDGGISVAGTLAGIGAAASVSAVGSVTGLSPWRLLPVSVAAAVSGMIADSYLGAWLERRGWLNNDAVNFLSTLVAAGVAIAMARFIAM